RRVDQRVERDVVEYLPPILQVAGFDARVGRLDPLRGHRRGRTSIVGPDLEAVMNPLSRARANAPGVDEERCQQTNQHDASRQARSRTSAVPVTSPVAHASFIYNARFSNLAGRESLAVGKLRT